MLGKLDKRHRGLKRWYSLVFGGGRDDVMAMWKEDKQRVGFDHHALVCTCGLDVRTSQDGTEVEQLYDSDGEPALKHGPGGLCGKVKCLVDGCESWLWFKARRPGGCGETGIWAETEGKGGPCKCTHYFNYEASGADRFAPREKFHPRKDIWELDRAFKNDIKRYAQEQMYNDFPKGSIVQQLMAYADENFRENLDSCESRDKFQDKVDRFVDYVRREYHDRVLKTNTPQYLCAVCKWLPTVSFFKVSFVTLLNLTPCCPFFGTQWKGPGNVTSTSQRTTTHGRPMICRARQSWWPALPPMVWRYVMARWWCRVARSRHAASTWRWSPLPRTSTPNGTKEPNFSSM